MPRFFDRIRERSGVERVFRFGKPFFAEDIGMRALLKDQSTGKKAYFSVVSPKKYFPTAVERNRFRRAISASVRAGVHIPFGYQLVFFPIKKPKRVAFSHFSPQVDTLVGRLMP